MSKKQVKHDATSQATEKDWEDFFADWDLSQGTTYPLDSDHEWLCVVSQHGRGQVQQAGERLACQEEEQKMPPPGYEFDR
jgi:hypothetical protein